MGVFVGVWVCGEGLNRGGCKRRVLVCGCVVETGMGAVLRGEGVFVGVGEVRSLARASRACVARVRISCDLGYVTGG